MVNVVGRKEVSALHLRMSIEEPYRSVDQIRSVVALKNCSSRLRHCRQDLEQISIKYNSLRTHQKKECL